MVKGIVVHEPGGAEVLRYEDVDVGEPAPGEARIRHEAIGLNFIDVYYRTGLYRAPDLPFIPGAEGAAIVVSVGEGVDHVRPGDRVSYLARLGAYTEERIIPADRLIRLPDTVDFRTAAAVTLKGLTAQYLLRQTFPVGSGHTILIHAAAGGVGLVACQWAAHLGATVIGTVGSREKAEIARAHGCHHVIDTSAESFVDRVLAITGGRKCDAVYDSVGRDTFPGSLDCLKPRGMWVLFGQSSGKIENFDLNLLAEKGSLYATRPIVFAYTAERKDLEAMAAELMDVLARGIVRVEVGREYRLKDAAEAHRALEARRTTGATVLIP